MRLMVAKITNTRGVELDRARESDLEDILALLGDCGLPTEGVARHLEHFQTLRRGTEVIGCAGLEIYGRAALLRSVAVQSAWRGHAFGRILTQAALERARELGVSKMYLLTETAVPYFRRFGFEVLERPRVDPAVQKSVEFVSACPDTALAMSIDLQAE